MENQLKIDQNSSDNSLILIFVSGLPGIGKSTLFKNVIEHWTNSGYNVVKVESDVVRQEAIRLEKLKSENAHLTPLELEIKSKPVYTEMLHEEIREEIKGLSEEDGPSVFILDKNYVPENLREVIYDAAKANFETNYKSFLILPQQSYDPELAINVEGKECPFYLDTLCASLIRVFSRKGHMSLCHGYSHSFKCIVGVVRAYSGQSFEQIADKYDMKILHFDYFNADKLKVEPLRTRLLEKMLVIHDMIKNQDYDGDRCAELLFTDEELTTIICTYDNHTNEYTKIALEVENSA
jgi:hypothetical protein